MCILRYMANPDVHSMGLKIFLKIFDGQSSELNPLLFAPSVYNFTHIAVCTHKSDYFLNLGF